MPFKKNISVSSFFWQLALAASFLDLSSLTDLVWLWRVKFQKVWHFLGKPYIGINERLLLFIPVRRAWLRFLARSNNFMKPTHVKQEKPPSSSLIEIRLTGGGDRNKIKVAPLVTGPKHYQLGTYLELHIFKDREAIVQLFDLTTPRCVASI